VGSVPNEVIGFFNLPNSSNHTMILGLTQRTIFLQNIVTIDRLCGVVVRVLGYRFGGRVRFLALPEKKSSGSGTGSTQPREYN
jgi:hypothetical protein